MSTKRPLEDSSAPNPKKPKKGFQIGPANLPDGSWRRKNERIKRDLIERAQIKKSYAKLKERENIQPANIRYEDPDEERADGAVQDDVAEQPADPAPASLELHPDRQQMLGQGSAAPLRRPTADGNGAHSVDGDGQGEEGHASGQHAARGRRNKPAPFSREVRQANQRREEAERRAREREEAQAERQRRLEERERHRKAMAKARVGGKNGQRKLGRESKVLLDKVKRLMGKE